MLQRNPRKEVVVVRRIHAACSEVNALAFLQDLRNVAIYEPKVDTATVTPGDRTGLYTVQGHFAGLPYTSRFEYMLTDRGFRSHRLPDGLPSLDVNGAFVVKPDRSGGVEIIHVERYRLPLAMAPLKGILRRYVGRTMERELQTVRRHVEAAELA